MFVMEIILTAKKQVKKFKDWEKSVIVFVMVFVMVLSYGFCHGLFKDNFVAFVMVCHAIDLKNEKLLVITIS